MGNQILILAPKNLTNKEDTDKAYLLYLALHYRVLRERYGSLDAHAKLFYRTYLDDTFDGLGTALASQNGKEFEDVIRSAEGSEHIILARLVAIDLIAI